MMTAESGKPKWKVIGLWVLCALLAATFLMAGGTKLAGQQMHIDSFARWGYPQWFRLVVGAVELVGAGLLLIPRTAVYGAAALAVMMCGAVYTHLANAEAPGVVAPLVLLALVALVGYARRPERLMKTQSEAATST